MSSASSSSHPPAPSTSEHPLPIKSRQLQHRLVHSRISLDFRAALTAARSSPSSAPITGVAELAFLPLVDRLRQLTFCWRGGFVIDDVAVDGAASSFSLCSSSLFRFPSESALRDVRDARCLSLCFDDEQEEVSSGNVLVRVPKRVKEAMKRRERQRRKGAEEIDITGDQRAEGDLGQTLLLTVRFHIPRGCSGLDWWPDGIVTATAGAGGDASLWLPCMELMSERCTFDLDLLVPADCQAVASGRLRERRYEDDSRQAVRYSFVQEQPVPSRSVGVAVGRGWMLHVDEQLDWVSYFLPPAALPAFTHTMVASALVKACVQLLEPVLDAFPFPYLHIVFCPCRVPHVYAGLLLLPVELLTDARQLQPVYVNRPRIAYELAACWLSALQRETESDDWLAVGLSGWLQAAYIQRAFGRTESDWWLQQTALAVCREEADRSCVSEATRLCTMPHTSCTPDSAPHSDHGRASDIRPLQWSGYTHPSELRTAISRQKAAVVMRMLQERIGIDAFQQVWRRVMAEHCDRPQAQQAAAAPAGRAQPAADAGDGRTQESEEADAAGDSEQQALHSGVAAADRVVLPLSTSRFVDVVRELSSDADIGSFFNEWAACDSCPLLVASFSYNVKKKTTEVRLEQWQCSPSAPSPGSRLRFSGLCKFVIMEVERVTVQERRVSAERHEFEFSCLSKVRRNRKRKQYDREALQQMQQAELQKLLTRHNDTPVLYVRCDAQHAFMQPVDALGNEVMLCSQLQLEKDVRGQAEAICALHRLFLGGERQAERAREQRAQDWRVESAEAEGLRLTESALKACFANPHVYYRIRLLAARVLVLHSQRDVSESSSRAVLEAWLQEEERWDADREEWRPNDWTELSEALLASELPLELSRVHLTQQRLSPASVVRIVVSLLRDNDNERNAFADDQHLAALLLALGNLRLAETETKQLQQLVATVRRYLDHDAVLPSYQRCVTVAALSAACSLQLAHRLHDDVVDYASFLSAVQPPAVRVAAFRCILLLCQSVSSPHLPLLQAVFSERDLHVRCRQLRCWTRLLAEGQLSMYWTKAGGASKPMHPQVALLCDCMWASLLSSFISASSSAMGGLLYPVRSLTLALYRQLFGWQQSPTLHAKLMAAIAAREKADEEAGGAAGGGDGGRLSVHSRRVKATEALRRLRAKMRTDVPAANAAGEEEEEEEAAAGGQQRAATVLKFSKKRGTGGQYKLSEKVVYDAWQQQQHDDDQDEEWKGKD